MQGTLMIVVVSSTPNGIGHILTRPINSLTETNKVKTECGRQLKARIGTGGFGIESLTVFIQKPEAYNMCARCVNKLLNS